MSKRDEEIIAQYSKGDNEALCYRMAQRHGGIDRVDVENGKYICADGFTMGTKSLSLAERWAWESENLPNGGWEIMN